jgi:pimeloyl-ACP methyl ester carboxylesterase
MGEADALEALQDSMNVYGTDPDRTFLTGGSLGGYGTIRLGSLYPDLWNGAFAHCPVAYEDSTSSRYAGHFEPSGQVFTVDPLMVGLFDLPYRQASGTHDPLAPIVEDHRLRDQALADGLDLHYTEYLTGGHCWDDSEQVYPWIANHLNESVELIKDPRNLNPARVRYAIDPRQYPAGAETEGVVDVRDLGIRYQGAYWVSGMQERQAVDDQAAAGNSSASLTATIDATSHAIPGWQVSAQSCGSSTGLGGSLGGNPELTPRNPTPNQYQCQAQAHSGQLSNTLDVSSANLASATIDASRAQLGASSPLTLNATGDGPLSLTLANLSAASVQGSCVASFTSGPSSVVLQLNLLSTPCAITLS